MQSSANRVPASRKPRELRRHSNCTDGSSNTHYPAAMRSSCTSRFAGLLFLAMAGFVASAVLFAQGRFFGGGQIYVPDGTRTARELGSRSTGTPMWENPPGYEPEVFTFARLRYDAAPRPPGARRG